MRVLTRGDRERAERERLSPDAAFSDASEGRLVDEAPLARVREGGVRREPLALGALPVPSGQDTHALSPNEKGGGA